MKTTALLMAAGIAGCVMLTPVWAHQGHDHGASAQRSGEPQAHDAQAPESQAEVTSGKYQRSLQVYMVPDVTLVNANARPTRLRDLLAADGPVMLDFIYTTCTTICPTMSTAFSKVPDRLGAGPGKLRKISVSVDPEYDQPAQLKAYAMQFGAGPNWHFLTGSVEDVEALVRAFGNYHADNADYGPLTFLRPAPGKPWVRINGLASAEELVREYRNAVPN